MSQNQGVKIIYRNEHLDPMYEKEYSLRDYCDMLREDLLRLITDVEDMTYELTGNKSKEEWPDEAWAAFCKIKHKLLDKAGDIGRLPENVFPRTRTDGFGDEENQSAFVAKVFKGVK